MNSPSGTVSYYRKGSDFGSPISSSGLKNVPVLKTAMNIRGTWTDMPTPNPMSGRTDNPIAEWSHDIYIDASPAYNDALSSVRTYSNWAKTDDETIELGYSGSASVFAQYQEIGETTYHSLNGVLVKSPSKGSIRAYTSHGIDADHNALKYYSDGTGQGATLTLGYSDSTDVYAQRKMDGDSDYSTVGSYIRVTSPSKGSLRTCTGYGKDETDKIKYYYSDNSGYGREVNLDYSDSAHVYAQRKMDGDSDYSTAGYYLNIKAPSRGSIRAQATYNNHLYCGDDGDNDKITLSLGGSVDVFPAQKMDCDSNYGAGSNYIRVSAPSAPTVSARCHGSYGGVDYYNKKTIELGYGSSVYIYPQYKRSIDTSYSTDYAGWIEVTSPPDNSPANEKL